VLFLIFGIEVKWLNFGINDYYYLTLEGSPKSKDIQNKMQIVTKQNIKISTQVDNWNFKNLIRKNVMILQDIRFCFQSNYDNHYISEGKFHLKLLFNYDKART
jgi:predicted nucleic acid-binding protein